jgi:uncharacterized protein (TIGR00369 family)
MAGLEILQSVCSGALPRPPVDRLFGVRLADVAEARAVFEVPAHGWLANEFGTVYGGMIAFLAMSACSAAVQSVAAVGATYTALDVKVNFLRPVPTDGADIGATGGIVHLGRHLVVSNSEVTHHGRVVALATGTTALGTSESR